MKGAVSARAVHSTIALVKECISVQVIAHGEDLSICLFLVANIELQFPHRDISNPPDCQSLRVSDIAGVHSWAHHGAPSTMCEKCGTSTLGVKPTELTAWG